MAFLCDFAHSFTTNAKQDKIRCLLCFSVLLNHAKFRSPNWRLNNSFSRQQEKFSRIGDRIGRNFEPCSIFVKVLQVMK